MCNEAKVGRLVNMEYIKKKKNWGNLISILSENRNHFSLASDSINNGVEAFCKTLNTKHVVHASSNGSGKVWQSEPLISCFCETFDPILEGIFPECSRTRNVLNRYQSLLPLANVLRKKEDCKVVADKLKESVLSLEDLLPIEVIDASRHSNPNYCNQVIEAAESLELVAGCLYAIHDELTIHVPRWCALCFRKAPSSSIYCDSHKASKTNALQDTKNRKGKRIQARVPADILKKWKLHRSKRMSLGHDFSLLSSVSDVPYAINPEMSGIIVSEYIKDFVIDTQCKNWNQVWEHWDAVLKNCPNVNKIFNKQAADFSSWDDYRSAVLLTLKNRHETTQHPYWIFMMLIEAEDWLSIENEFSDLRLTDTENRILDLASRGISNINIAKELNVSRSYVGRIKKLNDIS